MPLAPRVAASIVDENDVGFSATATTDPVLGERALPTRGDSILLRHPAFDGVCRARVTAVSAYQITLTWLAGSPPPARRGRRITLPITAFRRDIVWWHRGEPDPAVWPLSTTPSSSTPSIYEVQSVLGRRIYNGRVQWLVRLVGVATAGWHDEDRLGGPRTPGKLRAYEMRHRSVAVLD